MCEHSVMGILHMREHSVWEYDICVNTVCGNMTYASTQSDGNMTYASTQCDGNITYA